MEEAEWRAILRRQKGVCGVCGKVPESKRLDIDHSHVRGWAKMPDEKRKRYVRGLLCRWCNYRVLRRGMTVEVLKAAAKYLEAYERRLASTP